MNSALTKYQRGGLSKYNPKKGLQQIAVAEVAEKHYARAKNAALLAQAIEKKLNEQAKFITWWDTEGPGSGEGGRPKKNPNRSVRVSRAGLDGLPDSMTISRWRQKLHPARFGDTLEKTIQRSVKFVEFQASAGSVGGMNQSESNEWYTPASYIEAARRVMAGIDLDPASSAVANETVQASRFYSVQDDGLAMRPWTGRIWLNPPYSGLAGSFIAALTEDFNGGHVQQAVALVSAHGTDAQWFQPLWDGLLCFTNHRLKFVNPVDGHPESGSNHGSVLVYFGPQRELFLSEFLSFGPVVERAR